MGTRLLALVAFTALLALCAGATAQAAITHPYTGVSLGPTGVGSSFSRVVGVAVAQTSGDVFVLDGEEGGRIYKFNAAGEPVDFSSTGTNVVGGTGSAGGSEEEIAVDDSKGPDAGDIYVANNQTVRIYAASGALLGELSGGEMCGVAVGTTGEVYVGIYPETVRRYKPVTNPVTNTNETASLQGLTAICNVAVDSSGDVYAATYYGGVRKYDAAQFEALSATGTLVDETGRTLAVDPANGTLFSDERTQIAQYDGTTEPPALEGTTGAFGEGTLNGSFGVAVNHTNGDVYAANIETVEIFGPGIRVAGASTEGATGLTATEATLHAAVEPAGTEVTACSFEYGTAPGELTHSASCEPKPPYTGNTPVAVTGHLTGLSAGSIYQYRIVVSGAQGAERSFATKGPQISSVGVNPLPTSANVEAYIDPAGEKTTYHVEYGTTPAYGSSTEDAELEAGEESTRVIIPIKGLEQNTTYHFRLVATNAAATVTGTDVAFTTAKLVTNASFSKVGSTTASLSAELDPVGQPTSYVVEYGTSTAYGAKTSQVAVGSGETPVAIAARLEGLAPGTTYHARFVATDESRTATGPDLVFTTHVLAIVGLPDGRGYEMVTPAANEGAETYVPLDAGALFTEDAIRTFYPTAVSVDGSAVAYVGGPTSSGNGSQGESEGNQYLARRGPDGGWTQTDIQPAGYKTPTFREFSSDLQYSVLASSEPLSAGVPREYQDLYVHDNTTGASQPFFTGTPPYRSPTEFGVGTGSGTPIPLENFYAGASADFSHQLFEANDALTPQSQGGTESAFAQENNLYESGDGQLQAINLLRDGSPAPNATFGAQASNPREHDFSHVISNDGARVFWTDLNTGSLYVREDGIETKLIAEHATYLTASPDGSRVLYTNQAGDLTEDQVAAGVARDLTPNGKVLGILGTSEDLEYVYFAAEGALAAGSIQGHPNLYLFHDGETRFIATLGDTHEEDLEQFFKEVLPWSMELGARSAQVTPSGHDLVFMSMRPLTGYDNVIQGTGEAMHEVYVYDEESGTLSCASCDPTGEQPANVSFVDYLGGFLPIGGYSTLQPRLISEDGSQAFFESVQPLLPQAQNGVLNVYEWERAGAGSCHLANGCIYLLSTGASSTPSYLIGASESGKDVFLITRSQLVPADQNEYNDVYDARVGAVEGPAAPQCTGSGCQGTQATPPVFATPASVTYAGVGNFPGATKAAAKTPVKPKKKQRCIAKAKKGTAKGKKAAKTKPASCKVKKAKRARNAKSERGGR